MRKGKNEKMVVELNDFIFIKVINNLFYTFYQLLEWFVCGFENFINQMVKLPRHATEQPTAWPSPIFFISFSNWFLCLAHKHLSATPPRPPTAPPVTAATWICLHDHFYSILNL